MLKHRINLTSFKNFFLLKKHFNTKEINTEIKKQEVAINNQLSSNNDKFINIRKSVVYYEEKKKVNKTILQNIIFDITLSKKSAITKTKKKQENIFSKSLNSDSEEEDEHEENDNELEANSRFKNEKLVEKIDFLSKYLNYLRSYSIFYTNSKCNR